MEYVHQRTRNPIRITRALWRTLKNPESTADALILEDVYNNSRLARRFSGWDRVADRLLPDALNQEQLTRLPRLVGLDAENMIKRHAPGTVGYALASHMLANKLNPNLFEPITISSGRDYVINHITETHDVWHVVTGYGTDIPGEVALISFYAANADLPIAALLLGLAMLNTAFFAHDQLGNRVEAIAEGWQAGKRARPLFGLDWQAEFDRPLLEFRQAMKLPLAAQVGKGITDEWTQVA